MAITKRKGKYGVKFYVQVCVNNQRAGKTFDTLSEAARWQEETEALMRAGKPPVGEIAADDMLFSEASDRAIKESVGKVSKGQIENYRYAQAQYLKSFGEVATIGKISKPDVATHMLRRSNEDGVGVSIIRTELAFLRSVYVKAETWGYSYQSPELTIKRPRPKMKSREDALNRVVKADELAAILDEAKKRKSNLYQFLMFLLYTGMRPSEAASLRWARMPIREEKEAIKSMLPVGYVDLKRGGFSQVGTKTETRFVPAHPVVIDLLGKVQREEGKQLVFLDDFFAGKARAYLHYRRSMLTTIKNARLPDGSRLRDDIDFYSFRHTARSAMSVCKIPVEIAETIIGHQDRSFKFTYIHLSDDDLIREIGKLKYPGL